jgi:hypothetical protein
MEILDNSLRLHSLKQKWWGGEAAPPFLQKIGNGVLLKNLP